MEEQQLVKLLLVAETNFLVGFGLQQGVDFDYLTNLAAAKKITLAIPEISFKEAQSTLRLNLIDTRHILEQTLGVIRQIRRSQYARDAAQRTSAALTELITLVKARSASISQTLDLLANTTRIISYSPQAMARGRLRYIGGEAPNLEEDCEIYENILEFVRAEATNFDHTIFLTLDKEHFDCDEIRDELAALDVDLVFTTGECIAMVRHALGI